MTDKFRNTYRIASARARFWNYGWNAAYFVTICTGNRECFFGAVKDGNMLLSELGRIAHRCWLEIPRHFSFVELDQFVVMPNHVHGIIIIDKPGWVDPASVETQDLASLQPQPPAPPTTTMNHFGPQSKNLASIIRGFKIGVTKDARRFNPAFAWQARYHDHIIRDDRSYQTIYQYILNNPSNWSADKFYAPLGSPD